MDDSKNPAHGPRDGRAKRRFIAGAVCPRCGVMDRIIVEEAGSAEACRRCVDCGYSDSLMPGSGGLPGTRFSRQAVLPDDGGSRPTKVKILTPGAKER